MRFLATLGATASLLSTAVNALEPITVKGNAFFAGNERFYVRGVDYQPGGPSKLQDPLSKPEVCKRDIPFFKDLGLNAIRVYTIDNSKDHSECMKLLEEAGIYLILDVNTPQLSINREYPKESYNDLYLQHVFATIDVFAKYDNTLGFFAANEVINMKNYTAPAVYVKAVVRDMRKYIKERDYRFIPVGYSAADISENRYEMATYLNCGPDEERSDFFAFNDYSWCAGTKSSYTISGYDQKVAKFKDYSIPLFFSEYGCNVPRPREWVEISAIYSNKMSPVFSGGLAYEFTEEENNYGIVEIKNKKVETGTEYDNLKAQLEKFPAVKGDGGYLKDGKASTCPPVGEFWDVEPDSTLPEMPSSASKYFKNGAGKPLGTARTNMYIPGKSTPSPAPTDDASDEEPKDDKKNAGTSLKGGVAVLSALVGGFIGGVMLFM